MWLGPLAELSTPGRLPSPSRGQFAAFSVTEFGGLYGAGGIGSLTQPLLGERIQAALKPNRVLVGASGDSLNVLAERHGTTVITMGSLNPTLTARPSEQLPLGSWLFILKCRGSANADTSTTSVTSGFYPPETLATYLGVSLSTIYNWKSRGYGPPVVKLGNLVRYTLKDVEVWHARQRELSGGGGRRSRLLLLGSLGVGVAAVLVAVEVLFAGYGPAAAQHCSSDQRNREQALHRTGVI